MVPGWISKGGLGGRAGQNEKEKGRPKGEKGEGSGKDCEEIDLVGEKSVSSAIHLSNPNFTTADHHTAVTPWTVHIPQCTPHGRNPAACTNHAYSRCVAKSSDISDTHEGIQAVYSVFLRRKPTTKIAHTHIVGYATNCMDTTADKVSSPPIMTI